MLAVKNSDGSDAERYVYDKAGNMVKKKILRSGRAGAPRTPQSEDYITTTFTFDGANQLVSSTTDGVTTKYAYDAAGRLVKEGSKTYRYGYLDKVLSVTDGKSKFTYDYHADGQIASADYGDGNKEDFLWDGLALVKRGGERFINEPHIGGGNPVVSSKGTSYFNDMLGTTLGAKTNGKKYSAAALTAFGEDLTVNSSEAASRSPFPVPHSPFFTGKPHVAGLGHAFLFRNYRAGLGKWQTADPVGYQDGWNQLAYGVNSPGLGVDVFGATWQTYSFAIQKTNVGLVQMLGPGLPLDVDLSSIYKIDARLFDLIVDLIAQQIQDGIIGVGFADFLRAYCNAASQQGYGDSVQPVAADYIERAAEIANRVGALDWYVTLDPLSVTFDADETSNLISVRSMSVIWMVRVHCLLE